MLANPKQKYRVHSLERGLDLIELLAKTPAGKSLKELSLEAGFNMSTAHRILNALKARGYVRQEEANLRYKPTFKLFELGTRAVESLNLREEAIPTLQELADRTGESAYLIIRDENEALCLERIDGFHYVKILALKVGGRMPLHLGAGPRVLMAYLSDEEVDRTLRLKGLPSWTSKSITDPAKLKKSLRKIRKEGYSISVDDVVEGAAAIACPVKNWKGDVVAAISISGSSGHFKKEDLPELISAVKNSCTKVSRSLKAPD